MRAWRRGWETSCSSASVSVCERGRAPAPATIYLHTYTFVLTTLPPRPPPPTPSPRHFRTSCPTRLPAFVRGRGSRSSSVPKPRFQPPTAVLVYDEKIRTGKKDRKPPGISTPLEILTFFKKKRGDIVLSSSHSVPWVSAPSPPCCEGGQPRHPPLIIVASGSKLPALVKSSATTRGFLAGFQVDLHTH